MKISNSNLENKNIQQEQLNRIFTVPNLLSLFRLILIPFFIWLYCFKQEYLGTSIILVLSGVTDMADGFIARRFHAISNLGKVLDPIADKLTQMTMLVCLMTRFPLIAVLIVLFVLKESFMSLTGLWIIKKTNHVYGAQWHGKIVTCLLYATIIIHVVWYNIPCNISDILIYICMAAMTLSFVLYGVRNIKAILTGNAI